MLVAIVLLAALLSADSLANVEHRVRLTDPFTFGNPAFCAPPDLVNDFGLSRLPAVRDVPESGELPFAPRTVHLIDSAGLFGGPVIPLGENFGYRLWSENYSGRTPLDWTLRARMFVVSRSGGTGREVDNREVKVRTISGGDEVDLSLDPLRRAGFYRYDIEITDGPGIVLGRYSTYLKVFARSYWKARLGLNDDSFRAGEQVLSRVENLGTKRVRYGEAFSVQRQEGNGWIPLPSNRRWRLVFGLVGPGDSGRCSQLLLPDDFSAGHYRIVKEVGPHPWPNGKRSYHLTAPFEVIG